MKKRLIGIILMCTLIFTSVAGCSSDKAKDQKSDKNKAAENTNAGKDGEEPTTGSTQGAGGQDPYLFEDSSLGIKYRWPDAWYKALYEGGCIIPSGTANGLTFDYLTKEGREAVKKLMTGAGDTVSEETQKEAGKLMEQNTIPLCAILAEKDGKKDTDLRNRYPMEEELGKKAGTVYSLLTNPDADLSKLKEEDQKEFKALTESIADIKKDITLSGKPDAFSKDAFTFDSKTMDGDKIDSSVFQKNKLTMINIWATWCGPCVEELPKLQELTKKLPEGVELLGICTDGNEEAELAKNILKKSKVNYKTIVANDKMMKGPLKNIQGYPTTIFVDSEGKLVGEPFAGVPSGDVIKGYLKLIDERLAKLGQ